MSARNLAASLAMPFPAEEEQDRLLIRRGALSVAYDPVEFWYRDVPVPLSPSEGALLALLMRRGRASWDAVDELLRDGEPSKTIRSVLVFRIRRKFEAIGAGTPIETVRGWGLKLRVEQHPGMSSGVLIGGRMSAFGPSPGPAEPLRRHLG